MPSASHPPLFHPNIKAPPHSKSGCITQRSKRNQRPQNPARCNTCKLWVCSSRLVYWAWPLLGHNTSRINWLQAEKAMLIAIWLAVVHSLQDFMLQQLKKAILFKYVCITAWSILLTGHHAGGRLTHFPTHLYRTRLSYQLLKGPWVVNILSQLPLQQHFRF